ncbi:MAG: hypothetical protein U9N41_03475 [Euryarchaeota archaeon]|nr:hypothetical protein [Euryarchaeota archaeon]
MPSNQTIMEGEIYAKTTIEHNPNSENAGIFRGLATAIYENKEMVSPTPLSKEELANWHSASDKRRERNTGLEEVHSIEIDSNVFTFFC